MANVMAAPLIEPVNDSTPTGAVTVPEKVPRRRLSVVMCNVWTNSDPWKANRAFHVPRTSVGEPAVAEGDDDDDWNGPECVIASAPVKSAATTTTTPTLGAKAVRGRVGGAT
jgi:hypothetical protein